MRAIALILVLYGQVLSPFLCCCASESAVKFNAVSSDSPQLKCDHCCKKTQPVSTDPLPSPPTKHGPCPVQSRLLDQSPIANVEKSNAVTVFFFLDWNAVFSSNFDDDSYVKALSKPDIGDTPTLLMTELRQRFHHCLLC